MTRHPYSEKLTITHEEINALPLSSFEGPIEIISHPEKVNRAFEEVMSHSIIGFDTETKPVFVRGHRNKVAILQVALPEKVFLIRLLATGLTPEIVNFFQHEDIRKVGVAIRDDIKALQLLKKFKPAGFVELTELTRAAGLQVESVKKLTALMLGFRISKGAQTSNWEAEELDIKQIRYAATDAWVCLQIYHKLQAHSSGSGRR